MTANGSLPWRGNTRIFDGVIVQLIGQEAFVFEKVMVKKICLNYIFNLNK
jgi:hypothetical protein